MHANRDTVVLSQRDGLAHRGWVAGVEAARDVGGGDVLHHLLVEAHLPGPEAFPHVATDVYLHGVHLPFRPSSMLAGSPPSAPDVPRGPLGPRRGSQSGSGSCRWSWFGLACRGPRL